MSTNELKIPKIDRRKLSKMDLEEFYGFCQKISNMNKKWIKVHFKPKNTTWVLVDKQGRQYDSGKTSEIPSIYSITNSWDSFNKTLYLLLKPKHVFFDRTYFLPSSELENIAKIFKRSKNDFSEYKYKKSGIVCINAQSGLFNKLKDYAVGSLVIKRPLVDEADEEGPRHEEGTTVAEISNIEKGYDRIIYMASQNQDEIKARFKKVTVDKHDTRGPKKRVERLHRLDDPILDIFDTYHMRIKTKFNNRNPLILCAQKDRYNFKKA